MRSRTAPHSSLRLASIVSCALSVAWVSLGCAGFSAVPSTEPGALVSDGPMTQARMEFIFAENVEAIMGPPGAIQTRIDGINVYLISDPTNDRMRIVAPVAITTNADPSLRDVLLRANFHSTLDARYALSDGIIYAAFLHPISSLSPELLESALVQVLNLAKSFGSTFSSGGLHFGLPNEADH